MGLSLLRFGYDGIIRIGVRYVSGIFTDDFADHFVAVVSLHHVHGKQRPVGPSP